MNTQAAISRLTAKQRTTEVKVSAQIPEGLWRAVWCGCVHKNEKWFCTVTCRKLVVSYLHHTHHHTFTSTISRRTTLRGGGSSCQDVKLPGPAAGVSHPWWRQSGYWCGRHFDHNSQKRTSLNAALLSPTWIINHGPIWVWGNLSSNHHYLPLPRWVCIPNWKCLALPSRKIKESQKLNRLVCPWPCHFWRSLSVG